MLARFLLYIKIGNVPKEVVNSVKQQHLCMRIASRQTFKINATLSCL